MLSVQTIFECKKHFCTSNLINIWMVLKKYAHLCIWYTFKTTIVNYTMRLLHCHKSVKHWVNILKPSIEFMKVKLFERSHCQT